MILNSYGLLPISMYIYTCDMYTYNELRIIRVLKILIAVPFVSQLNKILENSGRNNRWFFMGGSRTY